MKYILLRGTSVVDLSLKVDQALEQGWELYGDPIVTVASAPDGSTGFYQAIVNNGHGDEGNIINQWQRDA